MGEQISRPAAVISEVGESAVAAAGVAAEVVSLQISGSFAGTNGLTAGSELIEYRCWSTCGFHWLNRSAGYGPISYPGSSSGKPP